MSRVGQKIFETRKLKGLSQEKLAELSKVNLRTIQRIENNDNEPHGKTLNLICDALEINIEDLNKNKKPIEKKIINWFFLIVLNLLLISIFGYLIIDSNANWNSRIGGFLLSFFIPYFIVSLTKNMSGVNRIYKFGSGFIIYIVLANIMTEFNGLVVLFLTPCLLIASGILYYGNSIIKIAD